MPSRVRNALANTALVLASIVATLLVLEGGLRLFWSGYYLKVSKAYATPDLQRGWRNKPNVHIPWGEPEFSTMVTHNSWGYRGPEITKERVEGRFRIFALGDSFTYGVGVQDDETFSARLEQMDPTLELINAGVNGYGTSQELLVLRDEALAFQPDLVLVGFFWNDAANTYLRGFPDFELENGEIRFTPQKEPETPQATAAPPARRSLLRHSYAYRFLSDRIKMVRFHAKLALGVAIEDTRLGSDQQDPAWELTLALLGELDRLAREGGANTLLVLIPDQVQVQKDWVITGLQPADYDVQERLHEWAAGSGVAVLDLLPGLAAEYARDPTPLYYRKDRHLNARGHAVAARLIYEELDRRGYVSQQARAVPVAVGMGPPEPGS